MTKAQFIYFTADGYGAGALGRHMNITCALNNTQLESSFLKTSFILGNFWLVYDAL